MKFFTLMFIVLTLGHSAFAQSQASGFSTAVTDEIYGRASKTELGRGVVKMDEYGRDADTEASMILNEEAMYMAEQVFGAFLERSFFAKSCASPYMGISGCAEKPGQFYFNQFFYWLVEQRGGVVTKYQMRTYVNDLLSGRARRIY